MNTSLLSLVVSAILAGVLTVPNAGAQTVNTRVGEISLELGTPDRASAERLFDELDFRNAPFTICRPVHASNQSSCVALN